MKIKKLSAIICFGVISFFVLKANKTSADTIQVIVNNPIFTDDFDKLVGNILQWVLSVAGSVALIMLVVGGISYIVSSGDEQRITSSKKIIKWAILGLMLILVSYSIIVVLNNILFEP